MYRLVLFGVAAVSCAIAIGCSPKAAPPPKTSGQQKVAPATQPAATPATQPSAKADKPMAMTGKDKRPPNVFDTAPGVGTKATCPVMNEVFTVKEGTPRSAYGGKHYVFCCAPCKKKFDANPGKYAAK